MYYIYVTVLWKLTCVRSYALSFNVKDHCISVADKSCYYYLQFSSFLDVWTTGFLALGCQRGQNHIFGVKCHSCLPWKLSMVHINEIQFLTDTTNIWWCFQSHVATTAELTMLSNNSFHHMKSGYCKHVKTSTLIRSHSNRIRVYVDMTSAWRSFGCQERFGPRTSVRKLASMVFLSAGSPVVHGRSSSRNHASGRAWLRTLPLESLM